MFTEPTLILKWFGINILILCTTLKSVQIIQHKLFLPDLSQFKLKTLMFNVYVSSIPRTE